MLVENLFRKLERPLFALKLFFLESENERGQPNVALKFSHVLSFFALQVSFEHIYYAFANKPDKIFWIRLKVMIFALARKKDDLESRKVLCFQNPKTLIVPNGLGYKFR